MADRDEIKKRILEDEDYIRCPKFHNSLNKFLAKNGDGVENSLIARFLMISEEEVSGIYENCVKELREEMEE